LLDAGAGAGEYRELVESKGYEYFGIDIEPRADFIQKADICELPFKGETFDCAIVVDVIEHIQDDTKAIKELKRVLKPEGFLIIHVPNKNQKHILIENPEEQHDHVRHGYSPLDLKQLFFEFRSCNYYPTFDEKESIAWDLNYFFTHTQQLSSEKLYNIVHTIVDDEKWQNDWIHFGWICIVRK